MEISPKKTSWLWRILWSMGAAIGLFLVYFVVSIPYALDDAYAQWGAVGLVVEYMQTHDGQWPDDWEDLRPIYARQGGLVGGWSFEKYKGRVGIDFQVNSDDLRRMSLASETVPFHVIWAKWPFAAEMGDGPDAMLHMYFRDQAGLVPPQQPDPTIPAPRPAR